MCGKFTAMASWGEVVNFSRLGSDGGDGERLTFRPMSLVPVIVYNHEFKPAACCKCVGASPIRLIRWVRNRATAALWPQSGLPQ